ncbi:MAG TPA: hypothetical protein VGK83_05170 [Acidimicrobiia bacterium]
MMTLIPITIVIIAAALAFSKNAWRESLGMVLLTLYCAGVAITTDSQFWMVMNIFGAMAAWGYAKDAARRARAEEVLAGG